MKVRPATLEGVVIVEPRVHGDSRGFFMEGWKASAFQRAGLPGRFVQANFSRSAGGVLRGLHYQFPRPQGKLVSVLDGSVFDVAVDIRPDSPGFGRWTGLELSAENQLQLFVPEGFAHGFYVLSETALVHYLCTREFVAEFDAAVAWGDPDIGIDWPAQPASVSAKDRDAPLLRDIPEDSLPRMGR